MAELAETREHPPERPQVPGGDVGIDIDGPSHTNVHILSYVVGTADSKGRASANVVLESAEDIAKKVGSEGKHDAKQVRSEDKHDVVISADDRAKQVGSEGNQVNVGRMDRWKRVANGKGKGGS